MTNFIKQLILTTREFTVVDFAIFKICLCAIGILLGVYFGAFFTSHITVVWICAIVSYIAIMTQLLRYYFKKKRGDD